MSVKTNSILIRRADAASSQPAGLPLSRELGGAYTRSLIIALLMAFASAAGLLYRASLYPTEDLRLSFIPSDIFNLAVGLPVLLGAMWLARRGSLSGLLVWPGALFYGVYMVVPYLIGVPFSVLSIIYLVMVVLSAFTLIDLLARIDGEQVRQRLKDFVPARSSAAILLGLAAMILVRQTAQIVNALSSSAPVDIIELSAWIADFVVAIPALLLVGIQLWRRQALGYTAGAGLLLGYSLLALGVIPFFVFQAHSSASPLDVGGVVAILFMCALCFIPFTFYLRGAASGRSLLDNLNATRLTAATAGVIFGIAGFNHGFFEFLQGNTPTNGLVIQAIGEAQRFWPLGTEEAFTIIPNFMLTGILAMLLGLTIIVWSVGFIQTRHGRTVFLSLFILLFLVGGGIGQLAFFLPAWAFATRMNKPLTWWRKVLPRRIWPYLSKLWIVLLVLASLLCLMGLEIAIFGFVPGLTDPEQIQNTALLLILSSAILYVITFIAGFGHELRRMEQENLTVNGRK